MSDFLNSIVHVVAELVMEKKKDGAPAEEKPIVPLTSREHRGLLIKSYCALIALSLLVGSDLLLK